MALYKLKEKKEGSWVWGRSMDYMVEMLFILLNLYLKCKNIIAKKRRKEEKVFEEEGKQLWLSS